MEKLIIYLKKNFKVIEDKNILKFQINDGNFEINIENKSWNLEEINFDHSRIFDLSKEENINVLILMTKLLNKYSVKNIILEKVWTLGHNNSSYLDIYIHRAG